MDGNLVRTGNLTHSTDQRTGTTHFEYDKLGRITKAGNELFAFDPAHNILSDHNSPTVPDNRLKTYNGSSYYYDCFGNLIHRELADGEVQNYFYDLYDQLVKAEIFKKDGTKETWAYTYDALGRRIGKGRLKNEEVSDDLEEETRFIWDGSHLLQEIQPDGRYTYLYTDPDSYEPLAQVRNHTNAEGESKQEIHYFHYDQIGIPREMTDKDGNLVWFGDYYGWGKLKNETNVTGTAHQPFRLQNQYYDTETGLHYNFYRYYEPNSGRFINQDPIRLWGGDNLYQFAPNVQFWIDSSGLARICTRPLSGMPFNFRTSGRTGLDLGLFHSHIFFDDDSNIGFTTTGLFQETNPNIINNSYKCASETLDDAILKQAIDDVTKRYRLINSASNYEWDHGEMFPDLENVPRYGNKSYNAITHNCQDFVSEVLERYREILNNKK